MINKCVGKEEAKVEQCAVNRVYKNNKRTGSEMQLTAQIIDYEMDQVIVDLGSDANVFLKNHGSGWEGLSSMATNSAEDGKIAEDHSYGTIAGDQHRY